MLYCIIIYQGESFVGISDRRETQTNRTGVSKDNWLANDALIMSFLLGSMEPSISQNFVLLNSAKEIWDVAKQAYGQSTR